MRDERELTIYGNGLNLAQDAELVALRHPVNTVAFKQGERIYKEASRIWREADRGMFPAQIIEAEERLRLLRLELEQLAS